MRSTFSVRQTSTILLLWLVPVLTACGHNDDAFDEIDSGTEVRQNTQPAEPDIQAAIRARLSNGGEATDVPLTPEQVNSARAAYEDRAYRPIWTGNVSAYKRAGSLLRELDSADRFALDPTSYDLGTLREALQRAFESSDTAEERGDRLADAELHFTRVFLELVDDVAEGPFSPQAAGGQWHVESSDADLARALSRAATNGPSSAIEGMASGHASYQQLQEALERYQRFAGAGFPHVPEGNVVRPGEDDPRIHTLHDRLRAEGFIDNDPPEDSTYTRLLAAALAEFQQTRGLAPDSILGSNTVAALNVSADDLARQIQVNIVRWQWMPVDLGERHVLVNLPEYRLYAYDNGSRALSMPVVIGAEYDERSTPAFSDHISYAVFRPYWNVPTSIAAEELVPRGPRDLEESGFEIVPRFDVTESEALHMTEENLEAVADGDLYIREKPGPNNSLGSVKYMFPNDFDIYLHDTPEDHLFSERERAFSHGCIRVEDPAALGAFLLHQRGWSTGEVDRRMKEAPPDERVDLRDPVPVFIIYFTAFVDDDGRTNFRDDLYGYDEPIRQALRRQTGDAARVQVQTLIELLPS